MKKFLSVYLLIFVYKFVTLCYNKNTDKNFFILLFILYAEVPGIPGTFVVYKREKSWYIKKKR